MDVATYLQSFESSLSSYTGDDPLDPWDKFVEYLEERLPAHDGSGMSLVFDSLVQRFLDVERYANDIRYVNYCIKSAGYYSEPVALFSHIYSKGVGTRTAALYLAWAQHFEQKDMNDHADALYQKAIENQAQPADRLLHEYRQFQTRTRSQATASGGRNPLQNSQLTNQMSHREPAVQVKAAVDPLKPAASKTTIIVSRSETSGAVSSSLSSGVQTVPAYSKDELVCEGSELCFEEVRAAKYFRELLEQQEKKDREHDEEMLWQQKSGLLSVQGMLEKLNQNLQPCGGVSSQAAQTVCVVDSAAGANPDPPQHSSGRPRPSNHLCSRRSLGLRLQTQLTSTHGSSAAPPAAQRQSRPTDTNTASSEASMVPPPSGQQLVSMEQRNPSIHMPACFSAAVLRQSDGSLEPPAARLDVSRPAEPEDKLDVSQGGVTANLSHITPNSSLGFVQATPSRVLPSPTVNTREALDVIMDMFQAPTLLEDPFNNTADGNTGNGGACLSPKPAATDPFTIFRDDTDKENGSAAASSKPIRALAELAVAKPERPNETPSDLMPDESTMWGARDNSLNSLAACPNSTTDFAMLAQFVSTPFTHKTPFTFFNEHDTNCDGGDADDNAFIRRQPKKLSPIIEQSPSEEKLSGTAVSQLLPSSASQGTIVGEGLAAAAQHCLTSSSITMVQPPPPAVLSFRDQTLCPWDSSVARTAGPGWEVYTSPERPPPESSLRPTREAFTIIEDSESSHKPDCDVPMSPDCPPHPGRPFIGGPAVTAEADPDVFLSPRQLQTADAGPAWSHDVPMSPEQPMSPPQVGAVDEPMMSPDRGQRLGLQPAQLLSDPWNHQLISDLLSTVNPPLAADPRCITWQCNVPNISPKITISMGAASLRVDCVLGEGAFATVYQATDLETSEKMVLKVQKPSNPWEFYINTQLDARLQPDLRHLYSSVRSAHLFNNGSVLLGELHNYGTLLNAVNIYKTLSDKVMPQPLVMFFSICILHMVEQLHSIQIIHADIKPDNFMLGQRFLENSCFRPEGVDHGLVLIDLGQSVDMELFPQGTAFTTKCLTSGFQCTEMLSGKPWSYQTDYFGIAGTVYCLLFGTYMQVTKDGGVWKTNAAFRRNPHSDLWLEFFHLLLNQPERGALHSLRCKLAAVLQQNYSSKLPSLKNRLVVLLLENRKAARR